MSDTLAEAYEHCVSMATRHYENFPVLSKMFPSELRGGVAAVYAFARQADDFADEGFEPGELRRERLANWRVQLYDASKGKAETPTFIALADVIQKFELPVELLDDLIRAFEMDTYEVRFPRFEDVLFYCKHSANPVGRLVLWLFGYRDEDRFQRSDAICTALQLANFWQDSSRDLKRNRIYYPIEDLNEFGLTEFDLMQMKHGSKTKQLVEKQIRRTQALFEQGRTLCDDVEGRLSFHLKLTWLGGYSITKKLEKNDFNPFFARPKIRALDKLGMVWNALHWNEKAVSVG